MQETATKRSVDR